MEIRLVLIRHGMTAANAERRYIGRRTDPPLSEQGRRELAVPYDVGRPFPLTALFCFAHIRRIHGRSYAIFAFNGEERPVF